MCCLFGLYDYGGTLSAKQKNRMIAALAAASEVRGIDATGIAYCMNGHLSVYKRPLPAHWMRFRIPEQAAAVMGHTRMTTQGSEYRNYNNHPFSGKAGQPFALAHNGVLTNDGLLRRQEKLPVSKIETDSFVIVQLLEQAGSIGFQIAPRLNAGGRLGDSNRCVELLLTDDAALGARIARELDETNAERQRLEAAIVREADRQVAANADFLRDKVLIAVGEGWNRGVVGLAAGRLTEKYAWPSIVFSREDGVCTGSARSVPGVNIHAVLSRCQDLYERFGGHAMAAGLTLKAEYMDEFRRRVNEAAAELAEPDAYIPSVLYDFDLPLREVTCELAEDLGRLAPNGIGNPAPVLAARGVHLLEARAVGAEGRHLKLRLEQDGASVGGIAFGLGGERANLPDTVDAIFSPTINEWMGRRSAEMDVKRLVPHAGLDAFRKGCAAREEAFALYLLQAEAAKDAPVEEEILRAQARQLLEESCQGTLLTVRTLEGALRWADWLAEAGLSDRLDCAFGKPADLRRYNCLCAMPAPGAEEGYRRVIALDDADVEAALRALMPSDDALRNLYRVLRAWPGAMKSEKALSQAAGLSAAATRLGLTAFDELGLVLLSREPFEAVLMPARRCSLSDSPTLKRLRLVCHWEEKA